MLFKFSFARVGGGAKVIPLVVSLFGFGVYSVWMLILHAVNACHERMVHAILGFVHHLQGHFFCITFTCIMHWHCLLVRFSLTAGSFRIICVGTQSGVRVIGQQYETS